MMADAVGMVARNSFSQKRRSWGEIAGFRIGRYKLSEATYLIYLKDDPPRRVFAEQVPRFARTRLDTQKSRIVTELSARIALPALAQADSRVAR
jgi:hypothetical protein